MRRVRRYDVTDRIVAADLCTGCGACAALAPERIEMRQTDDGFLRPEAQKLPRDLALTVMQICPGSGQQGTTTAPHHHMLWGGYHRVAQGWAADDALRFAAASGGALSAMLTGLLESGDVDGVLQIGADPENPLGNINVVSRNRGDVMRAAASRYAPSAPLMDVPALLEQGGRYAFVGKPCDVSALRSWAKLDARVDAVFPVKLSFFCAGVPSVQGAEDIVEKLGFAPQEVTAFRYRGNGWPGRATAVGRDQKSNSMSYHDSWGGVLSRHVQPRCRICADGTGDAADLAFGDAWQTDAAGYPVFQERDGVSLILARTQLGDQLLTRASAQGWLRSDTLSIDAIEAMQPGQTRRRRDLLGRLMGRVLSGTPIPKYRDLGIWGCGRTVSVWRTLRAALGMMRRCHLRRGQS